MEQGTWWQAVGFCGFHHQMFLTMEHDFRVGQTRERDAGLRHFAGNRFVSEVETDPAAGRAADDPGQQLGGMEEIEIGIAGGVSCVPEDAGAGTQFDGGERELGVDGEGWGAAENEAWHGDILFAKGGFHGEHRCQCVLSGLGAFCGIALVQVAVVGVEAAWTEARCFREAMVEVECGRAGYDSGSVLAEIEIDEDFDVAASGVEALAEAIGNGRVIDERGKTDFRESCDDTDEAFLIGADGLEGQKDIGGACACGHFGFCERGAFAFGNAHGRLECDDLGEFMGFDMGPKPGGAAGDGDHACEVLCNLIPVKD